MDVSIPYTAGMLLGRGIDARTLKLGLMLAGSEKSPTSTQVNETNLQRSFVRTLCDVCDVLGIPPAYALKVEADIIKNEVVYSCLKALDVKNSFTIIFRGAFLHKKQELKLQPRQGESSSEDLANPGQSGIQSTSLISHKATHWVNSMQIGDEIILLVTLASSDQGKLDKMREKLSKCLNTFHISQKQIQEMKTIAKELDKKLSSTDYNDTKLHVGLGSFYLCNLNPHPYTMSGVVTALENFSDKCQGWKQMCNDKMFNDGYYETSVMNWHNGGTVKCEEGSLAGESIASCSCEGSVEYQAESLDSDVDHDSFSVLPTGELGHFYPFKVTLQSMEGGERYDDYNAWPTSLPPESTSLPPESILNKPYEDLHDLLISCNETVSKLKEFRDRRDLKHELHRLETDQVFNSIQDTQRLVLDTVRQLDMITLPDESTVRDFLCRTNISLDTAISFVEAVTTKLPPGGDLDLLLIGKTGHGKSSTGNSILGHEKFFYSADGNSVTNMSGVGWAEVDDRIIRVVDTPGVCDTNLSTTEDSIDLAMRSFSEAIAHCPEGFHALLVIIRFGTRMTDEEKKAIALLKCVLGEDVIRSYGICVITHGDNFVPKSKTTFEQWCRKQSGFLKDFFEECNYRCVLFDNNTEDDRKKKTQLINLVEKVDSLKCRGTRYTNSLFECVKRERERNQREEATAAITEELQRDLQLVQDYYNRMDETDEIRYRKELNELRRTVDNLSSRVLEENNGQLIDLVSTIFYLSDAIDTEIRKNADQKVLKAPVQITSTTNDAVGVTRQETTSPVGLDQCFVNLNVCVENDVTPRVDQMDEEVTEKVYQTMRREGKSCFPGCSKVWLKEGHCVTLQHLKIGDQVLVRDAKGHLMYDTVYMFGHCDDEAYTHFVVLEMGERENVYVSSQHYVFCVRDRVELCMTAEEVRVGDELLRLVSQDSTALAAVRVQGKRVERLKGLFAPFTMEGTIVVDNHLMSCYVQCVSHNTAHLLLGPVRQLYKMSPNALATVNNLGHLQCEKSVPWWARVAFKALKG